MKRLITIIALVFSIISVAQIKKIEITKPVEIGKVTPGGIFGIKCEKVDDTYLFTYRDTKFKNMDENKIFIIKDVDNAFDNLYLEIIDGFSKMPDQPVMLEFPDGYIYLSYRKFLGSTYVKITHSNSKSEYATLGFSQEITKKQVDKLFGK
ncbi:hypothetical protein [Flavobacterium kingsejongi]|uniref:Uncharacterized protein n=1 Tax=Flavobacterium kingsejongi TaxID=1678728 RepID=A0A2S1LQL7_9FLAO|nr:hypothetical protein [Flavobacterium kingsejongi]AWG26034.1 hypothetical protein FK004_12760 [Flavobacterium kingsejongi]